MNAAPVLITPVQALCASAVTRCMFEELEGFGIYFTNAANAYTTTYPIQPNTGHNVVVLSLSYFGARACLPIGIGQNNICSFVYFIYV